MESPNKLIGGYDHGASIALRMAAKWPNKFSKLIAFHPGIANPNESKAEFKKIKIPAMILWVPSDMFHPWSKWKIAVKSIPKVTVETVKVHPWNVECSYNSYQKFSN